MADQKETEMDLFELFRHLKKKTAVLLAVCLLSAVLGFLGTKLFISPNYTAVTRVYVLNRSDDTAVVSADFSLSNYMINDYQVLITGQNVTKAVAKQLNLDMTHEELAKRIRVSAPDNTRVLQISVTDTEARRAADIANAVRDIAAAQIKAIMDVDAVNLVYEAEVPEEPTSPNVWLNTAIAALVGLLAATGVYGVIFLLDDTLRTEEDVERYLGLSTLGVIPASKELDAMSDRVGTKKRPKKRGKAAWIELR